MYIYTHTHYIVCQLHVNKYVFKKIEKLWLLNIRHLTSSQDWVKFSPTLQGKTTDRFCCQGQHSSLPMQIKILENILAIKNLTLPITFPVRLGMAVMNVIFWYCIMNYVKLCHCSVTWYFPNEIWQSMMPQKSCIHLKRSTNWINVTEYEKFSVVSHPTPQWTFKKV